MAISKGKVIFWSALALVLIGGSVWAYNKFGKVSDTDDDKAKEDAEKEAENPSQSGGGASIPKDTKPPTGEVKQPPAVAKNKVFAKYDNMSIWIPLYANGKYKLGDLYRKTKKGEMIGTLSSKTVIDGQTYVIFKDIIAGKTSIINNSSVTIK